MLRLLLLRVHSLVHLSQDAESNVEVVVIAYFDLANVTGVENEIIL